MSGERRLMWAGAAGLLLLAGAIASDFLVGSFWAHHSLLTSLVANVLVVAITVIVLNEILERRDRRRWNLLAQNALFVLTQSARATWTAMIELLGITEVQGGDVDSLRADAHLASDTARLSAAADALLGQRDGRDRLQTIGQALSGHYAGVIASWAPVLVGARPYAEVLDRHVELAGRLEWLSSVLSQNEPAADQSRRDRTLVRSSIAAEHATALGGDEWLGEMIVSVVKLAIRLDVQSRELAFSLVSREWWAERTADLASDG
jgi:hypothetical protein